jgi:23S rRNA pseudouridine1911/1915/1917 synthase
MERRSLFVRRVEGPNVENTTPMTRFEKFEFNIPAENAGWRLDRFVATALEDESRSSVKRLLEDGRVEVGGAVVTAPDVRLSEGARVKVSVPVVEFSHELPAPCDIPLDILYEDDDVVVVSKTPGLIVHAGAGNEQDTFVNALVHRYGAGDEGFASIFDDPGRPGIVHRLDKWTSGCLVAAKTRETLDFLSSAFKRRDVEKRYVAVLKGRFERSRGVVDAPIARHPVRRKKMAVSEGGKSAVTRWRVLEEGGSEDKPLSLVELVIETGRTHQIRVHMASIGHPVAGDIVYGGKRAELGAPRTMLHAWRLAIPLPSTGERREFVAPIPIDMLEFIESHGMTPPDSSL